MEKNVILFDNKEKQQYEFHIEGFTPLIQYTRDKDQISLISTQVPSQLGGRGIASALIEEVLKDIEKQGLSLIPICPFIIAYIEKHPEWQKLTVKTKKK